ncbi:MAG: hypothetical protein ABEJ80_01845 [Halarchaeum sp.]
MVRLDATTGFRAVLGWFAAAPLGFAVVGVFTPPDPFTSLAYGIPAAFVAGGAGAYVAVRRRVAVNRLAWGLVAFYPATFAALVAIQTVAAATVGYLTGPWDDLGALAVGALVAYGVAFRRA